MKTYSWLDENKEIYLTISIDGDGKIVRINRNGTITTNINGVFLEFKARKVSHPSPEWLEITGAIIHDYPELSDHERHGELEIESDRISKKIVPWSQEEIDAEALAEINALIVFCKAEAKRRIIMLLPVSEGADYRDVETNMLAEMGFLINQRIDLPLDDQPELEALKNIWAGIKSIRAASNLIEPDIKKGLIKTKADISSHSFWPK